MEENLSREELLRMRFLPESTEAEAGNYSPLVLAFAGDAFCELIIRTMFVKRGNARPNDLNKKKNQYVKAGAQSAMMKAVEPMLTERERLIFRRGKNAKPHTMARNATVSEYHRATGFEALMGYLYLSGQVERALFLIGAGVDAVDEAGE